MIARVELAQARGCEPARKSFLRERRANSWYVECAGLGLTAMPARDHSFSYDPDPLMFDPLASRFSATETFIGINADRLDTSRFCTGAPQAMIPRPEPPTDGRADALARSAAPVRHVAEHGLQVLKLAVASDQLRGKRSPEHLESLRQAGPLLPLHFLGRGLDIKLSVSPASYGPPGPEEPGAGHIQPP
jgi:hypothetical protein